MNERESQRHAFLIMAHTDAPLLTTLLSLLDDERNDIYLHIDKRSHDLDPAAFIQRLEKARGIAIPRMVVNWGGFSQIECALRLLEAATSETHAFYHLISGADLPLLNQDDFHSFFARHLGREFVHFVPGPLPSHVVERVSRRYLFDSALQSSRPTLAHRIASRLEKASQLIQKALGYDRTRSMEQTLRWGSNWFSVGHGLACYIVSQRNWINEHFRGSRCGDEVFLQTLVMNSPFCDALFLQPDSGEPELGNLRLIDWARGLGASPHVWKQTDLEILRGASARGYVFSRKFSTAADPLVINAVKRQVARDADNSSVLDQEVQQ